MNIQVSQKSSFVIGEPSFADALAAVEVATDLDDAKKRYWATSLRQLAGYLGLPVETIPARITAISRSVAKLHPKRLGVNGKTFANHRANAKAALRWFNHQTHGSARRAPMDPELRDLWNRIGSKFAKDMLSPFFRFLTAMSVRANDVTDADVAAYVEHRRQTSFGKVRTSQVRQLVRYWNGCRAEIPGWPDVVLTEPPRKRTHDGPAFSEFPEGLREGIERSCSYLAKPHEARDGRLLKACSTSTIDLHRRVLVAAVRMAVSIGIPLDELRSLADLLKPERVEAIIDAYWKRDGDAPSVSTIDLVAKFATLARHEPNLAPEDLAKLDEIRRATELYRSSGLTPKNRAAVRQVLESGVWTKVVQLPSFLMAQADAHRKSSPLTAAVTAQIAVAVRILLVTPIRMQNLTDIEMGTNLVRPGGPEADYCLTFEHYDVKNHIPLEFELDETTSGLIDRYITNHRPQLMRGRNHDYLFPGSAGDKKQSDTFGLQITKRLWDCLGIELTPHQFRHCAAALLLQSHPGNYELVRQLLGHKNIRTTMNFYVGLETISATRIFSSIVTELDGPPSKKR